MRETGMKGGRNEGDGLRGEEGCRQARGGGEGGIQGKNEGRREGDRDGGKEEVEQLRREDSREEEKKGGVCMTDFTLKNNRKCTNWEQQFRNWSCNWVTSLHSSLLELFFELFRCQDKTLRTVSCYLMNRCSLAWWWHINNVLFLLLWCCYVCAGVVQSHCIRYSEAER